MRLPSGFQFDETMSGSYALVATPDEERPLVFTVRVRIPSIVQYIRDRHAELTGTLTAEGLADRVPVHGHLLLAPVSQRIIGYELNFTGNDGRPYQFTGRKELMLRALPRTLTELPAAIHDGAGNLVARSKLRFDLRSDWLRFATSLRLV